MFCNIIIMILHNMEYVYGKRKGKEEMENMNQEATQKKNMNAAPAGGKSGKKRIGLVFVCIFTVIAIIYVAFAIFFQSHFSFGTTLDGIDVSGRSVEKVQELIRAEIEGYSLELQEREGKTEVIYGSSFSIEPVFQGEIEELLKQQNGFMWIATLFKKEQLELEKVVSYDEKALEAALEALSCMQEANQRKPVDAGISEYSKQDGYVLVPADYGTAIDRDAFIKTIREAVMVLAGEINLDEAGCYKDPEITDDNKELSDLIDKLNGYTGMTITYDFGDDKEVLDGGTVSTWIVRDGLKAEIDNDAVLEYVKGLAKKYNTAYQSKSLKTSYGTTVTISGGHYGWRIDNGGEVEQILEDLKGGADVEREPVYLQTANTHGENDYGDSYVEINLTAQHLFCYKDGKLIVESDFVSGNVAKGHSSPTGAFSLTYKTTDAVLRGEDYETPVKYWMPFAGDVGMHDANWRNSFGGNIYKTSGSHGCINLPPSVAKTIYGVIEKGYAVLVYTLPGTESKGAQQQDAAAVVNAINTIGTVTLESATAITNARNLYNALPDSAKGYVTNYDVLTAAEAALAQIQAGQVPQETPQEQVPAIEEGQQTDDGTQ